MNKHLILLGAPGAGKGTQASLLVKNCSYSHISTGDLLRGEIAKGSELGDRVKSILASGDLVDDMTVLDLLKANIDLAQNQYIFDGFPRNIEQSKLLDDHILHDSTSLAIYFDIDFEVIVKRVINRRVAPKSGKIYNLITCPPKVEGKCDETGEDLILRKDDSEDVVRNRLKVFKDAIDPMLDYYKKLDRLKLIDADRDQETVFSSLKELLA